MRSTYKASLTIVGILGFPASPTVTTVSGTTQEALAVAGVSPTILNIPGEKPAGLTFAVPLNLTDWTGG